MNSYWRPLVSDDYKTLCEWGLFWRFPMPPSDFLPVDELGMFNGLMICDSESRPVCAGFIYETNSKVCWMEYIISNPKIKNKETRTLCINKLIELLSISSKNKGFKYIFTTVKNQNLISRYEVNGFQTGTKKSTEMIKIL